MPLGKTHSVLCVSCRLPVVTLYAYPEKRCGYTTTHPGTDQLIHVSCTQDEGHAGKHYDKFVCVRFAARAKLSAGAQGQTNRA
jgi:hypothetical protein